VEVMVDNPVLGPTKLEADYDNYKDPDLSDIPFPFHIVQKFGGLPVLDITVTNARMYNPYVVVPIPDNVEQAYAAAAADPQAKVEIQKAGSGVWFVTGASHNSVAVEFKDYIALVESPVGDNRAVPVFEALRKQFPNKKVRYVINTHHHFDHAGGLRHVVTEGAIILTQRDNKPYYEKVLAFGGTMKPRIEGITVQARVDGRNAIPRALQNPGQQSRRHDVDCLLPKDKLLVEADMWNPPAQPNAPPLAGVAAAEPLNLRANIDRLKLDVAQVAPLHGRMVPIAEFRRATGQGNTTN
jgi:glyoxylase-like metal-dependent hydrolase (beta-lactamase superfamily II)